jgi:phosphoglycolate phosphatase
LNIATPYRTIELSAQQMLMIDAGPRAGAWWRIWISYMFEHIRAVVFDFDGTLAVPNIDFGLMRRQVDAIVRRYGVDPAGVSHLYILEMIEAVRAQLGQTSKPGGNDFHREAHASILALEVECARRGGMLPGAVEVLQAVRQQGFKIAVVTRNSASAVRTICSAIDTLCDAFLPREAVRFVKPHPEHLQRALEQLRVPAQHTVIVGDGPIDIAAGKALGLTTVAVLTGGDRRESLLASQPDLILDSVADLLARLAGSKVPGSESPGPLSAPDVGEAS